MRIDPETGVRVRVDLSWKRYGNATVQDKFRRAEDGIHTQWLLKCDCGNKFWSNAEVIQRQPNLRCKECRNKSVAKARTTHGGRFTKVYNNRRCMLKRCYNENHKSYDNYGGEGVCVCIGWRATHGFPAFRDDMGPMPTQKHTIDRIDPWGNYTCGHCPECIEEGWIMNCRWATRREQANNRRNNVRLIAFGKSQTISEWALELGMDKTTIRKRWLKKWPHEKCLSKEDFRLNISP